MWTWNLWSGPWHIPGWEGGVLSPPTTFYWCQWGHHARRQLGQVSWAKAGHMLSLHKKHLYHPVGTGWGGCELCSLCHKEAKKASKPLFWGSLFFLVWFGRQGAPSAPAGPLRLGLRASKRLCHTGPGAALAAADYCSAEAKRDRVSSQRECPFLGMMSMAWPPEAPREGSGVGILEAATHPGWCSPTQCQLSEAEPQVWSFNPTQMETAKRPICWGQGIPSDVCKEKTERYY